MFSIENEKFVVGFIDYKMEYMINSKKAKLIIKYFKVQGNHNESIKCAKDHIAENYSSNPDFKGWEFKFVEGNIVVTNNNLNELEAKELDDVNSKYTTPIHYSFEFDEQYSYYLNNEVINQKKSEKYTGIINLKDIDKKLVDRYILPFRKDLKKVNEGQYQLIYDNKDKIEIKFDINSNTMFYEDSNVFKDKKLLKFLKEAKKVSINPDMNFFPLRYKTDKSFYILITNNITEVIECYKLKSLNYLNKQHNVFYVLKSNLDDQFSNHLSGFENYLIKELQAYVNHNRDLLYQIYNNQIGDFKKNTNITEIN